MNAHSFAEAFGFQRLRTAPYRNAAGQTVDAGANVPRFDHAADGAPLGLLVEGLPQHNAPDLTTTLIEGLPEKATVLNAVLLPDGQLLRRAVYTAGDPAGAMDAMLRTRGRHREIAVLAGHRPNLGGYVSWRRQAWALGGLIAISPAVVLAAVAGTPFVES